MATVTGEVGSDASASTLSAHIADTVRPHIFSFEPVEGWLECLGDGATDYYTNDGRIWRPEAGERFWVKPSAASWAEEDDWLCTDEFPCGNCSRPDPSALIDGLVADIPLAMASDSVDDDEWERGC